MKEKRNSFKKIILVFLIMILICLIFNSSSSDSKNKSDNLKDEFVQNNIDQPYSSWDNHPVQTNLPSNIFEYHFTYVLPENDQEKSDYGAHDWIADAALRLLYKSYPNDWNWLLHNEEDVIPDITLEDNSGYKDLNGNHNAVRSYIYFLLATQWPDFKSAPQDLFIVDEGEHIEEYNHGFTMKWMGKTDYHSYVYNVIDEGDMIYFVPKTPNHHDGPDQYAPQFAKWFGNIAVDCLARKDSQGKDSRTKVESGAFYLGCMTHYIVDLSSPAHLLEESDGWYVGDNIYHTWIENQQGKFSYWDNNLAGPSENMFECNPEEVLGMGYEDIESLHPDIAAVLCSINSLELAFGNIDEDKGLYVSDDFSRVVTKGDSYYWEWTSNDKDSNEPVHPDYPNGITKSHYIDNVEKLLNLAVYYTACAMLWVREEVNNRGGMDPNDIAKNPLPQEYEPQKLADPTMDMKERKESDKYYQELGIGYIFITLSIAAPIFVLVLAPKLLALSKKKEIQV